MPKLEPLTSIEVFSARETSLWWGFDAPPGYWINIAIGNKYGLIPARNKKDVKNQLKILRENMQKRYFKNA
jgi:hypothetical protein